MSRRVHLVGSVPLESAESVFQEVGARLKTCLHSVPDGETGDRTNWAAFQHIRLRNIEGLEEVGAMTLHGEVPVEVPHFRLAAGRTADTVDVGRTGYDEIAAQSYEGFKRARASGQIGEGTRFQVSIPTPTALAVAIQGDADQILPLFARALKRDIEGLVAKIPARDLLIQWDIAAETVAEEARRNSEQMMFALHPSYTFEALMASVADVANAVPADVELGLHLCYGSPEGRNIVEARDATVLTKIANDLSRRIKRSISYIHLPVPTESKENFFAPLAALKLKPETALILGLVHLEDGVEGARRRIAAAAKVLGPDFGIAAECGLGRLPRKIIPALLDLHKDVAAL